MTSKRTAGPPRPMRPGDLVATFNEELGEWTAAQIVGPDPDSQTVVVLDLDWSGPEPSSEADLLVAGPLQGMGATDRREWVLPRSYKVIGNAPPVPRGASGWSSRGWVTGRAFHERRMKASDPDWDFSLAVTRHGETGLNRVFADPDYTDPDALHLELSPGPVSGPTVDCQRLVTAFPNLVSLYVWGVMGHLENASALNRLVSLRRLELDEVFGMTAADCLDPLVMTRLEWIDLLQVPADYAAAMRRAWKPEIPKGVYLSITGGRTPQWVAQNMANPLRGWDGREGISSRAYAKARAAWNQTTPPILAALIADLTDQARHEQLAALGLAFADAFDELNKIWEFIETEERDDLLDGLANLVGHAPVADGVKRQEAIDSLLHTVNQARFW